MAVGFALRAHALPVSTPLLGIGGALSATGADLFAWLVWRATD